MLGPDFGGIVLVRARRWRRGSGTPGAEGAEVVWWVEVAWEGGGTRRSDCGCY